MRDRMAGMAGLRVLLIDLLGATAALDRLERKALAIGFIEQLVSSIWENARVPKRLAFVGDQDGVSYLKIDYRV